ncbi:hypothetical protein [Bacillus sp. Y1]|nr:hypothetical protein [Bacillus sp. Y1]
MLVNIVLSIAILLVIFNIHFGIIVARQYNSGLYGVVNWSMAFILFVTVVQKICGN